MNDFFADVDRRSEGVQGYLNDIDGANDTGAKSPGLE